MAYENLYSMTDDELREAISSHEEKSVSLYDKLAKGGNWFSRKKAIKVVEAEWPKQKESLNDIYNELKRRAEEC